MAGRGKDRKTEKREKKGFFGRLFGGKSEDAGEEKPEGKAEKKDAPPAKEKERKGTKTPGPAPGAASPKAPSDVLGPDEVATLAPGYVNAADVRAALDGARTLEADGADPFAVPPGEDPFAPPPGAGFGGDERTRQATLDPFAAPADPFAPQAEDPFARPSAPHAQDLLKTADPDALLPDFAASDVAPPPAPPPRPPAPPPPATPPVAREEAFDANALTFDEGPGDVAAPAPPPPAPPSADPFGPALEDEPPGAPAIDSDFDRVSAAPLPVEGHEEETLELDQPGFVQVPLGAEVRPPAARKARTQLDVRSIDADALEAQNAAREGTARVEPSDVAAARAPAARPAGPPPPRPLFSAVVRREDGSHKLGPKDPEVVLDLVSRVLAAPPVQGGWCDLLPGLERLSDGAVLGRLPEGTREEEDGSIVVPAPRARRTPRPSGDGAVVPALPEGSIVDRASGVAWVPPALARAVEGGPERSLPSDEGGLVLLVPPGARWQADGSYFLERLPEAEGALAAEPSEPSPPAAPAVVHPAHGPAFAVHRYLGIEEVVYSDGWAMATLPAEASVVEGSVVLPARARDLPGLVPAGLDVEQGPDGRSRLRLPEVAELDGRTLWIAPALPALPETEDDELRPRLASFGAPLETIEYLGIVDARYANGWVSLDLPAGAKVEGGRVYLPPEWGPLSDVGAEAAWFLRDEAGWLSAELPEGAEALGSVVLIPPSGVDRVATGSVAAARDQGTSPESVGGGLVPPPSALSPHGPEGGGTSPPPTTQGRSTLAKILDRAAAAPADAPERAEESAPVAAPPVATAEAPKPEEESPAVADAPVAAGEAPEPAEESPAGAEAPVATSEAPELPAQGDSTSTS